eukprot:TRINITY_DN5023_c0_g1_i1.p2 TRINITY_DN5023_c0_g1~~TRINITY_DN5023_c0_g1_i1.p2  ORF type:complete len:397 (+),score=56.36 TRINITY_DN5023_c0_g1_i1:243-1433(+)
MTSYVNVSAGPQLTRRFRRLLRVSDAKKAPIDGSDAVLDSDDRSGLDSDDRTGVDAARGRPADPLADGPETDSKSESDVDADTDPASDGKAHRGASADGRFGSGLDAGACKTPDGPEEFPDTSDTKRVGAGRSGSRTYRSSDDSSAARLTAAPLTGNAAVGLLTRSSAMPFCASSKGSEVAAGRSGAAPPLALEARLFVFVRVGRETGDSWRDERNVELGVAPASEDVACSPTDVTDAPDERSDASFSGLLEAFTPGTVAPCGLETRGFFGESGDLALFFTGCALSAVGESAADFGLDFFFTAFFGETSLVAAVALAAAVVLALDNGDGDTFAAGEGSGANTAGLLRPWHSNEAHDRFVAQSPVRSRSIRDGVECNFDKGADLLAAGVETDGTRVG